jgi:DNA-binding winged helix-turn-helix (wHTH) protein
MYDRTQVQRMLPSTHKHFGIFDLDLESGELRRNGVKLKLQEKPFQMLAILLERPGEVVTREALRERLWPAGTFVDFDHGLNTATKKLRQALGDSAENPRFIETLAGRGYRFIAPLAATEAAAVLQDEPNVGQRADRRSLWLAAGVAAVCLTGAVGIAIVHFGEQPPSFRPLHFQVQTPETQQFGGLFALSPDGRALAFIAMVADEPHLWVHSFETGQSRPLLKAGTFSSAMFWSPDSRFLAFPIEGKLKKISVVGEHVQTVCDLPPGSTWGGGAWNAENVIVFGGSAGLMQVSAAGGVATPVTVLDKSRGDMGHPGPWFLPDGRHLLYFRNSAIEHRGIYVASLDVEPDAQSLARLAAAASRPIYAAAGRRTGQLLFLRDQTLFAQPFDPEKRKLTDEAFIVAEQVGLDAGIALGWVSATPEGTLAYRAAVGISGAPMWVNRAGVEVVTIGAEIRQPRNPRLSPDGKRLVLVASGDLWEYDLQGRPPVKLTAEGRAASPLWTPDGKSLVYESGDAASLRIIAAAAGATAQPASPDGHYHPHGWSPDGRELIAVQFTGGQTGTDIVRFAPGVKSQRQFVVKTPARDGIDGMALSPDGRWLAYVSSTTGPPEVWVQAFPGPENPVRVSARGGVEPAWARDGRELYYLEANKLMAVAVDPGPEFNFTAPVPLFEYRYQRSGQPPSYDVGPDGRFLVIKTSNAPSSAITVISNWAQTAN